MKEIIREVWYGLWEDYRECKYKALVWIAVIGFILLVGIVGGME